MPIDKIILLYSNHKGNESRLSKYFLDEDCCWTYLGPDYLNFLKNEKYIDNRIQYIEISEKLDKISENIRDDYQFYVDSLNISHKDSFEWWFTPFSSRNPFMNSIFQNTCFLELINNLCRELNFKILIIVAENYSIGHSIESNADYLKTNIICIGRPIRTPLREISSGFLWIGKCLFKAVLDYIFAKISAYSTEINPSEKYSSISGKTCLIDVFVYENNFADDGGFADRYFPGLESFMIKNGYNVVYYPTFAETKLNKYHLYCKSRENKRVFLIAHDFLHIIDYVKSAILAVKSVHFYIKGPLFRGMDIGLIDSSDNKWFCYENIFKAYLQYFTFIRMSFYLGDKFERIISWHENQLQDKALCKAIHETFKGCKIVGSHGYIHDLNTLNFYPLYSESIAGYIPDVLLSSGAIVSRDLERYAKDVPIIPSVPLKYYYIITDHKRKSNTVNFSQNRSILILLPYSRVQRVELLSVVLRAIDSSIDTVYVRCHPDYKEEEIINLLTKIPHTAKIIFVDKEKLSDLFLQGHLIVSASSGTIIEAMAYGNPIIVVANKNSLSNSPVEKSYLSNEGMIITSYNDKSLFYAINKLRATQKSDTISEEHLLMNDYFYWDNTKYLLPYIQ